jgi:predicted  nucleic acid-binding Zn-ribbon protein
VHVLTKTLVVLAAVLSVALSALVIAYAVNTDRIAADYHNALRTVAVTEATAGQNNATYNATKVQLEASIAALNNQLLQAKKASDDLASENARLQTAVAKAESERQSIVNKIAELGETTKTQASIIQSYREENSALRNSDLSLRTRQAELDDRINDLESEREVLSQNYRALQEQIAEAKRAQEQMLNGSRSGSAGVLSPVTPLIKGSIEAVQYDDTLKKTIVKVNVGTNDRVAKNMVFHIVRGDAYVGKLQITHDPDLKYSVGEVTLLNTGQEVRAGDHVSTQL